MSHLMILQKMYAPDIMMIRREDFEQWYKRWEYLLDWTAAKWELVQIAAGHEPWPVERTKES